MTDISTVAGGRPPGNGTTYNPIVATAFVVGCPVAPSLTLPGEVVPGAANSANTTYLSGIAAGSGVLGSAVLVKFAGPLTLTTQQWDAITTQTGGLTLGVPYYLSATTGRLTTTAPSAGGTFIAPVGVAVSHTTLMIQISHPIANSP
jgi:hypothetical protein